MMKVNTIGELIKVLVKFPPETEVDIKSDYYAIDSSDSVTKYACLRINDKIDLVIKGTYNKFSGILIPKEKAEVKISDVVKDKENKDETRI